MGISRNILLWASDSPWMRLHVPKWKFVKKAIKKFMPGENAEDALAAAKKFQADSIPAVFTHLGENLQHLSEGLEVRDHYLELIDKIAEQKLDVEISLKLTQLGFDSSFEVTYERFKDITFKVREKLGNMIWIDMEGSNYTEKTLFFYKKIKSEFDNVGLCIQAYLHRTEKDLKDLMSIDGHIRLVKGAYREPADIAFNFKNYVDRNFLHLSKELLKIKSQKNIRVAFATHDEKICEQILRDAKHYSIPRNQVEFQMLYGIKSGYQKELAKKGYKVRVLISYGDFWYPWYMRRLAERPANVWFVLKNIF
ncbi:MAG: proline dehydrogenase [Ignavibacteriae bacterium HGW-Ignavibacteriae-3]|nr:MAG: proline dehydrogenase [Ignavibacteriae bacterium HGW-Ignavibacteriae-3]